MKASTLRPVLIVAALLVGVVCGLLVFAFQFQPGLKIAGYVHSAGVVWTNALRMAVIPLLVPTLIVVIARGTSKEVGRISGLTFVTFFGLMAFGATLVLLVLPPALPSLGVEKRAIPSQAVPSQAPGLEPSAVTADKDPILAAIISSLLSPNLVRAAANDDLLPIVVFSILLGLAATRVDRAKREVMILFLSAISEAMRVLIDWILWLLPLGVLAFSFSATATLGWNTVGMLGAWVVIVFGLCIGLTLLMYPVATAIGRVGLKSFAKAVLPAQGVGAATRSSLASLPALLRGARQHLPANEAVVSIVLPIAVSSFKLNRSITTTGRVLLLAHVYDVSLSPTTLATFLVSALLVSFSSPGLPARGPIASLALYLAVGIPLEGIVILRAVDSINDFPMTVLNVTADMTATTIVARFIREEDNDTVPMLSSDASEVPSASD